MYTNKRKLIRAWICDHAMSCTNTLAREPGRHERDKLGIAALLMMRRKPRKKG
jgi:hypothetical protein